MPRSLRRLAAAAIALVVLRSAVFLLWEQSYFDSDQAIFGLMATHISQGRAWPVFMYADTYMFALESWLAAPLFALFGPSVFLLKVPLFALNIAVAVGLPVILCRESALRPMDAFVASLFFLLPPLITASRLMDACGGNIEPLFFTVLLWLVRRRPVLFGLIAGLGIANREFVWYAVVAMAILDVWSGALTWRRLRQWLASAAVIALGLIAIHVAARHADALGPNSGPASPSVLIAANLSEMRPGVGDTAANVQWLVTRNLPVLFGSLPQPLADYHITSRLGSGTALAAIPLVGLGLAAVWYGARTLWGWCRALLSLRLPRPSRVASQFPVYLCLIALEASVAYVLAGPSARDPMLIRYTLLVLFGGVGLTAWLFQRAAGTARALITVSVVLWASLGLRDHARFLHEYVQHTPANAPRALIALLDAHHVRYGRADYWTTYLVDFLSHERITLATEMPVRVQSYQRAVDAARAPVTITPAARCRGPVRLEQWCISGLPESERIP